MLPVNHLYMLCAFAELNLLFAGAWGYLFIFFVVVLRHQVVLGQSKVADVQLVFLIFRLADQQVLGLDVTVEQSLAVHVPDDLDKLDADVQYRLQVKGLRVERHQLLKVLAE